MIHRLWPGLLWLAASPLSAQIIDPAEVIWHRREGIREVAISEYDGSATLKTSRICHYDRRCFLIKLENLREGGARISYRYDIDRRDSLIRVTESVDYPESSSRRDTQRQVFYRYAKNKLIEWSGETKAASRQYQVYLYDDYWNLVGRQIWRAAEDSTMIREDKYYVLHDAWQRIFRHRPGREDMTIVYDYDADDRLARRIYHDGQVRRSVEHVFYNRDDLPSCTVLLNRRGGALTSVTRYNYKTYWFTRTSVFEEIKPVESLLSIPPSL